MTCSRCGCEQGGSAQFCRQCGERFGQPGIPFQGWGQPGTAAAIPPYAAYEMNQARERVEGNLQPLAILWYCFGAIRIVTGLTAMLALHTMSHMGWCENGDTPPLLPELFHVLAPLVLVTAVVMGLLSLLVGYGLQTRQPWGRTLAIVFGILALIKIPVGTALGIYTLWVLTPSASGQEWQRLQRKAA